MTVKCSCGARDKAKCPKENGLGGGKMCLKPEDNLFINFRDTPNGGFCADIDYDSQAWQKLLNDWSEFKTEEQRLLKDPKYSKQWVEEEVKKSGEWFLEEIYK